MRTNLENWRCPAEAAALPGVNLFAALDLLRLVTAASHAIKQRANASMKWLAAIVGILLSIPTSAFVAGAYVNATYVCTPGPGEPCDAGGYVGLGLFILLTPVLALVFAVLGYWLVARRDRRRLESGGQAK